MNVFLSYKFTDSDEAFVRRVHYYLMKQPDLNAYFWHDDGRGNSIPEELRKAITGSEHFVLFVGRTSGDGTQASEAKVAAERLGIGLHLVRLPECPHDILDTLFLRPDTAKFRDVEQIAVKGLEAADALQCAKVLVRQMGSHWVGLDGLPIGYPFDYEKDIIEAYVKGRGRLVDDRLDQGCPEQWPSVPKHRSTSRSNPIPATEIGAYCPDAAQILVDARARYPTVESDASTPQRLEYLTFPEARPRAMLRYPLPGTGDVTVGILVSGGIAPGINAVIDGIVARHFLYQEKAGRAYRLTIYGYPNGLSAFVRRGPARTVLTRDHVRAHADSGGSILTTSRANVFLDGTDPLEREKALVEIVRRLDADGVQILYVIGGDGSMKAAHAIQVYARFLGVDLSVAAIPKTMDNDILWVWQSFGFLSAVQTAKEFVRQLHTEATSNPRLCVVQLFGSDSGFVVSHTALSSGVCDLVLIPEVPFSMKTISEYIVEKLKNRPRIGRDDSSPYGVVLMAETAIPEDVEQYIDDPNVGLEGGYGEEAGKEVNDRGDIADRDEKKAIRTFLNNGRRVRGQTPDALRTGGLKVVSRILQSEIRKIEAGNDYWKSFRVFTNEPRHLVRAITPSVSDVIFGQRLGILAVDNAMAGYSDFMISQWLTEYVLVPLELVVLGRKRVPRDGIFWKSVIASTGQPANLLEAQG